METPTTEITEARPRTGQSAENAFFDDLARRWEALLQQVKERPADYLVGAFIAGFVLNVLPIRTLLATTVRLSLVLAKPALLVAAAVWLFKAGREKVEQRRS
jgi:hypothetical protein